MILDHHILVSSILAVLVSHMRPAVSNFCASTDLTMGIDARVEHVFEHAGNIAIADWPPL